MKTKTILITGATSGIGRYAALHLAARGHRIFASGRNEKALTDLSNEAKNRQLRLHAIKLDVTSEASIEAAREEIDHLSDGHGIDSLINNAGYGHAGPMSEASDADIRQQYNTNVFGLMAVTRAFLPAMMQRRAGTIVNVSSVGGLFTLPFFGAYNSTKYAVESMSDALRIELRAFGINVVLVEPGVIRTNFTPRSMEIINVYGGSNAPFAGALSKFEKLTAASDRLAVSPKSVARAMTRAVEKRRPAARYIAPFRTRIALFLYRIMPTRTNDWFFRRMYGLTAKKLLNGDHPTALLDRSATAD